MHASLARLYRRMRGEGNSIGDLGQLIAITALDKEFHGRLFYWSGKYRRDSTYKSAYAVEKLENGPGEDMKSNSRALGWRQSDEARSPMRWWSPLNPDGRRRARHNDI